MNHAQKAALIRALRKRDTDFQEFVLACRGACLFAHDSTWKESSVEGILYLYRRTTAPHLRILLLNKKDLNEFCFDLSSECKIESHPSFLILHSESKELWGIWFHSESDATRLYDRITLELFKNIKV